MYFTTDVTCQYLVPTLIGTVRAFGRDTYPLVFPQLFPCQLRAKPASVSSSGSDKKTSRKIKQEGPLDLTIHFFTEVCIAIVYTYTYWDCFKVCQGQK